MNIQDFDIIYQQFTYYISSCTLADLNDEEIEEVLFQSLTRAIAAFRFPQLSLEYESFAATDCGENELLKYRFKEPIRQQEVNVLLAYMKKFWVEYQVSKESRFEVQYYDTNMRTHSQGNMMQQLNSLYKTAIAEADQVNYDYNRMTLAGKPTIGKLNGEI